MTQIREYFSLVDRLAQLTGVDKADINEFIESALQATEQNALQVQVTATSIPPSGYFSYINPEGKESFSELNKMQGHHAVQKHVLSTDEDYRAQLEANIKAATPLQNKATKRKSARKKAKR